jgi:hypothetical protein
MAFNNNAHGYQPLRLHPTGRPPCTRASASGTRRRLFGFAPVQVMLKGGVMPPRSKALRADSHEVCSGLRCSFKNRLLVGADGPA